MPHATEGRRVLFMTPGRARVVVVATVVAAGCGGHDGPPPRQTRDSVAAADTASWTADITSRAAAQPAPPATLVSVRTGRHAGFDRIVFEFAGDELPGYHIEYVDPPIRQCGSGHDVSLAEDATLEVRLSPARAHTDAGEPTIARRERSPELPALRELTITCDFEGHVTWVAGLSRAARYRVSQLEDPARLIVDLRHRAEPGARPRP